jgi:hypothetical protein
MSRALGAGLASLSAVLLATCAASAAAPAKPFPLEPGARWVLSDATGLELTISLTRGKRGHVLRGFPGLPATRVRASGRSVQAWDPGEARWKPFLRLGAPAGTRYRVQLAGAPLWRAVEVTVASRTATCDDANGRAVPNCVALELTPPKGVADAGVERLVFAPGVGPVEVVVQTIAGPRRYTLGEPGPPTR